MGVDSENQKQYTLVGVVTGNPSRSCTDRDLPDVYNFIGNEKILPWIRDQLSFINTETSVTTTSTVSSTTYSLTSTTATTTKTTKTTTTTDKSTSPLTSDTQDSLEGEVSQGEPSGSGSGLVQGCLRCRRNEVCRDGRCRSKFFG